LIKNKKIVVTGGAGFIGSNLSRALCKDNDVIAIDDLSTGHTNNIQDLIDNKSISFIKGSITDLNLLQKTFKNVDYAFHQAAISSVPRSVKDPVRSNLVNVNGTLNVLITAKENCVKKVVYASSSSVYGDTPTLPKKEDMIPDPLSPYGVSKLTGEYYCQVFTGVYGLPTVSLRYFNVYGPYQDPNGEYAAVIPKFINLVLNNKPPVIFGDGLQTRDFTYIQDVVNANVLAMESKAIGVFNAAGGKQITISKLAKIVTEKIGKDLQPVYNDPRPGDILHSYADITKAKKEIGYTPSFDIKNGLMETIKWFQR